MAVPIPFLSDIDLHKNKVFNSILEAAKFGELPAVPEAGHFYKKDGVLYYRDASNVEVPVHENALRTIASAADSPISLEIDGTSVEISIAEATDTTPGIISATDYAKLSTAVTQSGLTAIPPLDVDLTEEGTVQLSIAPADETNPGTLSPGQFALLAGATASPLEGTIVMRGSGGSGSNGDSRTSFLDIESRAVFASASVTTPEVTGLSANPTESSSATSKSYVDTLVQNSLRDAVSGFDRKAQGVRVAVERNTPLTSTFGTFDGIAIAATDPNKSILLYNQINPAENGAFDVTASGLVRRADSNTSANLTNGTSYQVESGTNANHIFTLVTQDGFAIDTDPLTFLDISGVNVLRDGNGISIVNQTINAKTTIGRLIVNTEGNLDIAPAYDTAVDQKIASAIAPLQDAAQVNSLINSALETYKAVSEFTTVLGDGVATTFTVAHNTNNSFPSVFGYYQNTPLGAVDFTVIDHNTIQVKASLGGTPIAADDLLVVVQAAKLVSVIAA